MAISAFVPMTKEDVSQVLRISIRTVENLVSSGAMPEPGRIGGRVLWHPEVFYIWLDQALRTKLDVGAISEPVDDAGDVPATRSCSPVPVRSIDTDRGGISQMKQRQSSKLKAATESLCS